VAVAEDGYLYIVGRAKDLIIVSGFNVYPAEVEHVVADFPGVAEVAVIGVPDADTGEAVKAIVVAAGQHLDPDALIAYCRDHLARYKCPTAVEIVDALPKGMAGKLLRSRLR
jgi:long-chain acyl-CoA synthetase